MTVSGPSGDIDGLLSQCLGLVLDCEFQEIWSEILCRHATVVGPPIQYEMGWGSEIRVPLTTGDGQLPTDNRSLTKQKTPSNLAVLGAWIKRCFAADYQHTSSGPADARVK